MIFRETWQQVLDGTKTQTRRLIREGDSAWPPEPDSPIRAVAYSNGRAKWRVGEIYAVQPGQSKKSLARIRLLAIRRERLQDISGEDAIAEGVVLLPRSLLRMPEASFPLHEMMVGLREQYLRVAFSLFPELWDELHPKGKRWEDNPEVWVLEFELVGGD